MSNAFWQVYRERLTHATRPYKARGGQVSRCTACWLPKALCICQHRQPVSAGVEVVLLMHRDEVFKPTNTGRLIADILPAQTRVIVWERLSPGPALESILGDPARECVLVFPQAALPERPAWVARTTGACQHSITLIVPDGTWRQAGRMVRLSPYLQRLPLIGVDSQTAYYSARQAPGRGQLSTAEAVTQVLKGLQEIEAACALEHYFQAFNYNYRLVRGRDV